MLLTLKLELQALYLSILHLLIRQLNLEVSPTDDLLYCIKIIQKEDLFWRLHVLAVFVTLDRDLPKLLRLSFPKIVI